MGRRSKISMFIRWCAMRSGGCARSNIEELALCQRKSAVAPEVFQLRLLCCARCRSGVGCWCLPI
jgi:hypothetical protein